jgi:hypothetical protein
MFFVGMIFLSHYLKPATVTILRYAGIQSARFSILPHRDRGLLHCLAAASGWQALNGVREKQIPEQGFFPGTRMHGPVQMAVVTAKHEPVALVKAAGGNIV